MAATLIVDEWQNAVIPHSFEPTENMMVWMSAYEVPCPRLCCLSEDCGAIKCDGCRRKLTCRPPFARYECCDCPWLGSNIENYDMLAEKLRTTYTDIRPTLCEACFRDERVVHHHSNFLQVAPNGVHTLVERDSACVAGVRELVLEDFQIVCPSWPTGKECQSYCCDNEYPPVAPPGCSKGHGLPSTDNKTLGAVDSREYMCGPCSLQFLRSARVSEKAICGGGPSPFCAVCVQEAQVTSFSAEFHRAKTRILETLEDPVSDVFASLNATLGTKLGMTVEEEEFEAKTEGGSDTRLSLLKRHLHRLHPQPWLRAEIDML